MGSTASSLTPERRAKLAQMSESDQIKLQKQVEELKGLGLSEEAAVERMIKEFEDAVADDWAWGMPGKDVVRRDSIYSDEDNRSDAKSGSRANSIAGSPARPSHMMADSK